jgi:hypothetical protein
MQFPLKINRDKHVSAEHSGGAPSKLFPCGDCGVVFYTQEAQTYHSKSTHKRYVQCSTVIENCIGEWSSLTAIEHFIKSADL